MPDLTAADLDRLYAPPAESIQRAVLPRLADFHEAYLAQATFFCLATGRAEGLDASPRGGPPGFVKVLDPGHVAFADWPGNNRIETLRNLVEDERVALLFLSPGLDVFLRINGRGRVSDEAALLQRRKEGDKLPKTAVVVMINEVLFHCGKALHRARLWSPEARLDRASVPSIGKMKAALSGSSPADAARLDANYREAIRTNLY
ncbi:MSMEG_1061 family FMN-dependent PPOX-type flavoprotein [Sphingomonas sp. DT-51]|uniref:MSMEG_1061 family FMN-dependent PPOX-type flavoprotein n=1 Tax=Sphingomonas sp. DT-51 TaxID=3396165 RepID=UPI003F1C1BD9